jgi:uncharacterized protein YlxW (UPF0749 family)
MEKKGFNWKVQMTFVVTGILFGLLVTAQIRSALPPSSYPYDEYKIQQDLIKSYTDDQSVLKDKILNLRKEIDDKQKQSVASAQKNNLDVLQQLEQEIGLESTQGAGVSISLDDSPFAQRADSAGTEQFLVQAADLRDIVNLLFSAGAQGLAINGQRVIASTPITSVGNTILVNNTHVLPPFSIAAVGTPGLMLQRLDDPTALPDLEKRIKGQKLQYSFRQQANVSVPVYNGDFPLKYVQTANAAQP